MHVCAHMCVRVVLCAGLSACVGFMHVHMQPVYHLLRCALPLRSLTCQSKFSSRTMEGAGIGNGEPLEIGWSKIGQLGQKTQVSRVQAPILLRIRIF